MLKRVGITVLSIAVWFAIAGFGTYLLGIDGFILAALGITISGATSHWLYRRRIERVVVAETDERGVRLDGNLARGQAAIDIGTSSGWIAERLPQEHSKKLSVRFEPSEASSSARKLVRDLFDAGLARDVRT